MSEGLRERKRISVYANVVPPQIRRSIVQAAVNFNLEQDGEKPRLRPNVLQKSNLTATILSKDDINSKTKKTGGVFEILKDVKPLKKRAQAKELSNKKDLVVTTLPVKDLTPRVHMKVQMH